MTTGKHSELQTLQNSDGTFELVVSSEAADEWSDVEDLRVTETPKKARSFAWKPIIGVVIAVGVLGFIATKVVNSLSGGVLVDEEPLPMVAGFRPYLGGAAGALGSARSTRPAVGKQNQQAEDDWVDPETEERELVVEQGEPALPAAQVAPQVEEEGEVEEGLENHEAEPSAPEISNDDSTIQKNLNNQLRGLSNDRVNMPFPRENLRALLPNINGTPTDDPAIEEPEDGEQGDLQPSEENEQESEE